jgi:hypothetical protein
MNPPPHRSVAVPEKEVSFQVCTDHRYFFAAPPRRSQGSPVLSAEQTSKLDSPLPAGKGTTGTELFYGASDDIALGVHASS